MFYHYFKFCTEEDVFTITNLSIDVIPLYTKTEEKIRFLNYVNHYNLWKEEQNNKNLEIKQFDKFYDKFSYKSNIELQEIVEANKDRFVPIARKVAKELLI